MRGPVLGMWQFEVSSSTLPVAGFEARGETPLSSQLDNKMLSAFENIIAASCQEVGSRYCLIRLDRRSWISQWLKKKMDDCVNLMAKESCKGLNLALGRTHQIKKSVLQDTLWDRLKAHQPIRALA
jgi:hypothetical protein